MNRPSKDGLRGRMVHNLQPGRRSLTLANAFVVGTVVFLGVGVASSPTKAQLTTKLAVVGVLSPFIDADSTFLRDLRDRLADRGLREGRDIRVEYRSTEGQIDRLLPLAQELVRLKVDVIVTASAPA